MCNRLAVIAITGAFFVSHQVAPTVGSRGVEIAGAQVSFDTGVAR